MPKTCKPRVVLVYDAIYPYSKGGGERRFYELGTRLARQGYDVHWYGMRYWEGSKTYQLDGMTLHGLCKARPLYTADGRRSIFQALIFGLSAVKLVGIKFDVIDCCGFPYFSLFPAKVAAIVRRKALYATWHEVWGKVYWKEYLGALGSVGWLVERLAAKLPSAVIAPSQHVADALYVQLGVKTVHIVANGIDVKSLQAVKPATKKSDLVYAGRVMHHKGLDLLIEALAVLKKRGLRPKLAIVGDGPATKELQALATKRQVDAQITWHGFLEKSSDVYQNIKASKVFVLPSKREGFGIVAIEANACGVPVLTADYPGNAAKDLIVDGKNGYVFKPNPASLADTIAQATSNATRLKATAASSAQKYDWDNLVKGQAEAYGQSNMPSKGFTSNR